MRVFNSITLNILCSNCKVTALILNTQGNGKGGGPGGKDHNYSNSSGPGGYPQKGHGGYPQRNGHAKDYKDYNGGGRGSSSGFEHGAGGGGPGRESYGKGRLVGPDVDLIEILINRKIIYFCRKIRNL
jgi:hypothetical protein